MKRAAVAFALAVAAAAGACTPSFSDGEFGTLRYAGRVKGTTPLNLLPPVADPSGNVYVLNGAPTLPETHAFVGFAGGGWSAGCALSKGDLFGAHGWVGYATSREWYWSGAALVAVSGADGSCHAVLDRDPATAADLQFQAVLPGVRNLAERTTVVALVQSPSDPLPFSAMVDLEAEFLTNVTPFQPSDAESVLVVGVGGSREQQVGVAVVQYVEGGTPHLEARWFDGDANMTAVVPLGGGPFGAYAVQGYLELGEGGRFSGLVTQNDGSLALMTFDRGGGQISAVTAMQIPVGVHAWGGRTFVVGEANGQPAIAPIDAGGNVGGAVAWRASSALVSLGDATPVRDDRSLPSRATTWTGVKTAVGDFPFLSAHSLTAQGPNTTLWVFAGPSIDSGGYSLTSFAMAPVGVSYP